MSTPDLPTPTPSPSGGVGAVVAAMIGLVGVALVVTAIVIVVRDQRDPIAIATSASAMDGTFAFWVTDDDGTPARWDPCEPIAWVLYDRGAPVEALADLEAGFDEIARVTGLEFTYEGEVDEAPTRDRALYQPERYGERWAPVLVAYTSPGATDVPLEETDRAVSVPIAVNPSAGPPEFVSGQLVFNAERRLAPGFDDRHGSWGATILHELGHLVGLDHVDDPHELMFEQATFGPVAWGPGDLAGLAALGAGGGCVNGPPPQDLDVRLELD